MTLKETLQAISNYPIPNNVLATAGLKGGIELTAEATIEIIQSLGYLKAQEQVLTFLVSAPNSISEMGVSYSLGDSERLELRKQLEEVKNKVALDEGKPYKSTGFGFFGATL